MTRNPNTIEKLLERDDIATQVGDALAKALKVRQDSFTGRWHTGWGTKTSAGLARTVHAQISKIAGLCSGAPAAAVVPCPVWTDAAGYDRYGAWAEITIEPEEGGLPVVQRLRWCPPGTFLMGSPADEPGHSNNEGPQHQVTITEGFWMFDTPCTQALWEAVMRSNPSRFKSPERPVERVSWDDAQWFVARINERVPGLGLTLPTEAQWEYACRAGTQTALYTGPIRILDGFYAPALDAIAWYGGNSGVGFELADGHDASDWPERQYSEAKAGTHPVRGKAPNAWGLYDMIGNVLEWVEDRWYLAYSGAPTDGSARYGTHNGINRVIRGGSWHDEARDCRCADRDGEAPDARSDDLGFRCVAK